MIRGYLLYLLLLISGQIRPNASQILSFENGPWSILPTSPFRWLCPNTDICSTKLKYNVANDGEACCRGCSCESDCGLSKNCCFEELGNNRGTPETKTDACVTPVTALPVKDKRQPIQSYFMVDTCPGDLACSTCGNTKVAEWGSLHPVYSLRTGLIYKNRQCADCYNVTDGQVWNPYLVVNMDDHESTAVTAGHILTSKLTDTRGMMVRFLPSNETAVEGLACYEDLIRSNCEFNGRYQLFGNFTAHDLCDSGLIAPVLYEGNFYANIFCINCFLSYTEITKRSCSAPKDLVTGDFVASIDKAVTFQRGLSENELVCSKDNETCKEVLCPVGRMRQEGECVVFHAKWVYKDVRMMLEFSPETYSDEVSRYENGDIGVSVSFPEGLGWKLRSTILEVEDTDHIAHLYGDFVMEDANTDQMMPADVLDKAKSLVKHTKGSLKQAGTTYTYDASISRYAYLGKHLKNNQTSVQPLWFGVKQNMANGDEPGAYNNVPEMKIVTENDLDIDPDGIPISLNKLFFCQQVELFAGEFKTFYNGTQIYYNKKYFFDGQFALNVHEDGSKIARICLDDSGYYEITAGAHCTRACTMYMAMFISVALAFMMIGF